MGRVESKRAKVLVGIALGMTLVIAGMAPAWADSPNKLFKITGRPLAGADWTTCPEFFEPGQVCVDTGVLVGHFTTQNKSGINNPAWFESATAKENCIFISQSAFTTSEDGFFLWLWGTYGQLCGNDIHFRSSGLNVISASGTIPLTTCTATPPTPENPNIVCAPDGSATVNLTWTGFGPRFHLNDRMKFVYLGATTCLYHDLGLFRDATVTGTITGLPVDSLGTTVGSGVSDQMSYALVHGEKCLR